MIDPKQKYDEALAEFATPHNRWSGASKLTYWAAACGISTEEVIEAAHAVGVRSRDTDLRRGMVSAMTRVQSNAAKWGNHSTITGGNYTRPTNKPKSKPRTDAVRTLIEAGKAATTPLLLRLMSPTKFPFDNSEQTLRTMTEIQLSRMFDLDDLVRVRKSKTDNEKSRPNKNLKPLRDWLADLRRANLGEIVRVNPLSGEQGLTKDGRPSFDALACVAKFRHAVMEFDELPFDKQCQFWAGFIAHSPLAKRLICLVSSGGKSIHGVLRVDAPDAETFGKYRTLLVERFASDPDRQYRLDEQALNPLTGCRLAGICRADTGKTQELLFACLEARADLQPPSKESDTPPDNFKAHCNSCHSRGFCQSVFARTWQEKSSGGIGCNNPPMPRHNAGEDTPQVDTFTTPTTEQPNLL